MKSYFIKRLLSLIPVVIGVVTLTFLIIHLIPGDPAYLILGENASPTDIVKLRSQLGLDQPILIQYGNYVINLIKGNIGTSFYYKKPVTDLFFERFINTFLLTTTALIFSIIVSLLIGIWSAKNRGKLSDKLSLFASVISVCMPVFWLGPLLILVFSVKLNWLPISGFNGISGLILPALTLGLGITATNIRIIRAAMIEIFNKPFVLLGYAKGLKKSYVIFHHALKNILIPLVTIVGLQLGALLGGAVITEVVFSFPGVGRLLILAILRRDYPLIQGVILLIALIYILINLITDLFYSYLDPQIRFE